MPVVVQSLPVEFSAADIERLWQETLSHTARPDEDVNIKVVSEEEIRRLNHEYRQKDTPTNVLTFSYEGEHDVALCWTVIEREAAERGMPLRDYAALVVVHAFLHVGGMDHERSAAEAAQTNQAEQEILAKAGFPAASL